MNSVNLNEKFSTIHQLARRVHHHQRAEAQGPTQAQKRILAALALQDGISTRELAFILGIRVPSLNETLSKLEQAELVTREQSQEDRRIMIIKLTDAGREAAAEKPQETDIYSIFSDEEKAELGAYLDRLIEHLEETTAPFESEDRESWEQAMRSRFGDERFEKWMERAEEMGMRGGPRGRRGFRAPWGAERRDERRGRRGEPRGDFGEDYRGERRGRDDNRGPKEHRGGGRPHHSRDGFDGPRQGWDESWGEGWSEEGRGKERHHHAKSHRKNGKKRGSFDQEVRTFSSGS